MANHPTGPTSNIDASGRRRRLLGGLVALAFGSLLGLAMLFGGMSRLWRLVLFLPFAYAGFGIFQARGHT